MRLDRESSNFFRMSRIHRHRFWLFRRFRTNSLRGRLPYSRRFQEVLSPTLHLTPSRHERLRRSTTGMQKRQNKLPGDVVHQHFHCLCDSGCCIQHLRVCPRQLSAAQRNATTATATRHCRFRGTMMQPLWFCVIHCKSFLGSNCFSVMRLLFAAQHV